MNIEIYSVKGMSGLLLKEKLEAALQTNHLSCSVNLINSVDQFIQAGLSSVPALKIGKKIIGHPSSEALDVMVQRAVDFILEERVHSILVPIDFSPESVHGLKYAYMMASHLQLGVTLIYVHYPVYDPVTSTSLNGYLVRENEKKLASLVAEIDETMPRGPNKVPVFTHVEEGTITSSLTDFFQDQKYELMIMGTKGTDNGLRHIIGSVSSTVSLHGNKPVIVVPPQAELILPTKVVIGFTDEFLIDEGLKAVLELGMANQVFFDFVHVTDDKKVFKKLKDKLYLSLHAYKDLQYDFHLRSAGEQHLHVHEALIAYAQDIEAGMILLMTKHRSFMENLLHKSVTKKAILYSKIPIMVLHPFSSAGES
jgi:nucleotide-binding universal stress UspA family protein